MNWREMGRVTRCKDCTRRKPGCHSKCADYEKVRERSKIIAKKRLSENEANRVAIERFYRKIGQKVGE